MMEPTHLRDRDDPPGLWCLDGARLGCVLLQAQVCATPMIIVRESSEVARQAGFTEYDHVIQALPPNRADHPLDVGSLPRRPGCREHLFDAHRLHLLHEVRPEDPIAIAQQIARRGLPRKGLPQLLSSPFCSRMSGDAKMQNAPTVMGQHQEDIQDLEPDRRHRKEVDGNQGLQVIVEEGPPGLGRRLAAAHQVLAHTGLADVDAELEQLAVNPRRSPEWVLTTHGANQLAYLLGDAGSPRLTVSDLPGPEQAKAFPVPANDGRGLDDKDAGLPIVPDGAQPGPQQAIRRCQFRSFYGALQNAELMAEREDLELKRRTAAEGSE